MAHMRVTADTFHDPMSWSKEEASRSMLFISRTDDISHDPMSWLKEEAWLNM